MPTSPPKISEEKQFQLVIEKSLLPENQTRQLHIMSQWRRPLSFDKLQLQREESLEQGKRYPQKKESAKERDIPLQIN